MCKVAVYECNELHNLSVQRDILRIVSAYSGTSDELANIKKGIEGSNNNKNTHNKHTFSICAQAVLKFSPPSALRPTA